MLVLDALFSKRTKLTGLCFCLAVWPVTLLAIEKHYSAPKPKIVVVGAGIAGLTAAYVLKRDYGLEPTIYEASNRVGGKIFTGEFKESGVRVELGASFIDEDHLAIRALAEELGLTVTTLKSAGSQRTYFFDGKVKDPEIMYHEFLPTLTLIEQDLERIRQERASAKFCPNHPTQTLTPREHTLNQMSIDEYLTSLGAEKLFKALAHVTHACEYGASIDRLNALMLLNFMTIDLKRGHFLIDGKKGDEGTKIKGGNSLLPEALAKKLPSLINYGHVLTEIKKENALFELTFLHAAEVKRIVADYVVLALPTPILSDIKMDHENLLSPNLRRAIANFDYGDVTKFIMLFSAPVWQKSPHHMVEIVTERYSVWDSSFFEDGNLAYHLTVYMGGPEAAEAHDDEAFAAQTLETLEPLIPGLKQHYIGTAPSIHWPRYPFSKSGFSGPIRPGQWQDYCAFDEYAANNLAFAGEQWSREHGGFMNGAVESGIKAAKYIFSQIELDSLINQRTH